MTVKAYQTHLEQGEFVYILLDDSVVVDAAVLDRYESSSEMYAMAEDALMVGIRQAETLNGTPFAPSHRFEYFMLDEVDDMRWTSDWLTKESLLEEVVQPPPTVTPPEIIDVWVAAYRLLGGTISDEACRSVLELFNEFVANAVTGAPQDKAMIYEAKQRNVPYRQVALDRWTAFATRLGHPATEARKLWQAVDSVTALS